MSMRLVLFEDQRQENQQLSGTVKIGWEQRRECDRGGGEGTERAGLSWVLRLSCVRYEEQLRGEEDEKTSMQGHRKRKKQTITKRNGKTE